MSEQDSNTIFLCAIKWGQIMFVGQEWPWMLVYTPNWERQGARNIHIWQFGCKRSNPHFLSAGGKLLILYLYCLREWLPRQEQREEFTGWWFFQLLQGGEVYKRLRSQVRGSQSRQRRCLRGVLKAAVVPCTYEHNIISYAVSQLCEDVFSLQIKRTGNGLAHTGGDGCTMQYSQSHRDYLAQGSY